MMRYGGWSGADWLLMSVGMLLFWTLIVAGVVWLVRGLRAPVSGAPRPAQRLMKVSALIRSHSLLAARAAVRSPRRWGR